MISIILPTYNREQYLREAVDSVFTQTYPDWELIVIDDGSTDRTAEYLGGLHDPRVRVIAHERCGNPARLRNAGIGRATGDYLSFLDSDDLWLPDKLRVQLEALATIPDCRWCFTGFECIGEHGEARPALGPKPLAARCGWMLEPILQEDVLIAMPSVLAEKSLVTEVGAFDESLNLCEDYDLWLRLAVRAQAVALPAQLTKVRVHAASYARERKVEAFELLERVFQKLLKDLAEENLRGLARRRYARALIALAAFHRTAGQPGAALRALGKALRYRPPHKAWWSALGKTLIRPLIPGRVMSRYRNA
jgi:glycosyltransferase involved in cell wall biosynthesis